MTKDSQSPRRAVAEILGKTERTKAQQSAQKIYDFLNAFKHTQYNEITLMGVDPNFPKPHTGFRGSDRIKLDNAKLSSLDDVTPLEAINHLKAEAKGMAEGEISIGNRVFCRELLRFAEGLSTAIHEAGYDINQAYAGFYYKKIAEFRELLVEGRQAGLFTDYNPIANVPGREAQKSSRAE